MVAMMVETWTGGPTPRAKATTGTSLRPALANAPKVASIPVVSAEGGYGQPLAAGERAGLPAAARPHPSATVTPAASAAAAHPCFPPPCRRHRGGPVPPLPPAGVQGLPGAWHGGECCSAARGGPGPLVSEAPATLERGTRGRRRLSALEAGGFAASSESPSALYFPPTGPTRCRRPGRASLTDRLSPARPAPTTVPCRCPAPPCS